jgi:GNAT superfamily N-acetyltransferase
MYLSHQNLRCWEPRRWEGQVFHRSTADFLANRQKIAEKVGILQDEELGIRGFVTFEYEGSAMLQTQRGDVEADARLLDWALENMRHQDGWLEVWCEDSDKEREELLTSKGFRPTSEHQNKRRQSLLDRDFPTSNLPTGYTIRSFDGTRADADRMADLLNVAFGRTFHSGEEYMNFATMSPSFSAELQVVVVNENGDFVSHAGFTAHPEAGFLVVEPVCTHPDHQNLGLARAAISYGLQLGKRLGVETAYIEAWYSNPVSNRAYQLAGFELYEVERIWRLDA